jgi:hypothetical protein
MDVKEIEKEIKSCNLRFIDKMLNLWSFLIVTFSTELFSKFALNNEIIVKALNDDDPNIINRYNEHKNELEQSYKNSIDYINEMSYKDCFQAFEEFLYDIFLVLFQNYPIYIYREKSSKTELDYNIIFKESDIESLKRKIIEKKVKSIIQSNNIKKIINKFAYVFDIDITIAKEDIDSLFLASRIRNVLSHNNGKINSMFLSDLNKENIQTNYNLNDRIKINDDDIRTVQKLVKSVSIIITKNTINKLNQLENYSLHNS